jgi:hypothetical protein
MVTLAFAQDCYQVGDTPNEMQQLEHYEMHHINMEKYHHEGDNMMNWGIAINATWARAYEPELKHTVLLMTSSAFTTKYEVQQYPSPMKLMIILACDIHSKSYHSNFFLGGGGGANFE